MPDVAKGGRPPQTNGPGDPQRREGVLAKVPSPKPTGFLLKPVKPFETHILHPIRSAPTLAGQNIQDSPDANTDWDPDGLHVSVDP